MEPIQPRTGDVILLERLGGTNQPLSEFIQRITGSDFSHSIVALGDGCYADATAVPGGKSDIEKYRGDVLAAILANAVRMELFRPPTGFPVADAKRLDAAVTSFIRRATPPPLLNVPPDVMFSMGAGLTLAALRALQQVLRLPVLWRRDEAVKVETAMFWALENGDRRLYCSEFVHVVLDEAGQRPTLPEEPVINPFRFPTDEPPGESLRSWLDVVGDFFRRVGAWMRERLELDEQLWPTITEEWERIRCAYYEGLTPERLTIANFFTPADFERSPSLERIASRRRRDGVDTGWVSVAGTAG